MKKLHRRAFSRRSIKMMNSSKYSPHQGTQEKERRLKRMGK